MEKHWIEVRPEPPGHFTVQVVGIPDLRATAATREQAIEQVRTLLGERIGSGKLVAVEAAPSTSLPPLRFPAHLDMASQIQLLVRTALLNMPDYSADLYGRLIRDVERELIEQVMEQANGVVVKAATRLGINRNTLHKKLSEFSLVEKPENAAE